MDIWQILMTPFSWLLKLFCELFNSYGIALLLFTVIIKLIFFPFSLKSKKSMIEMNLLSAQQREIQKKYPNDRNKQNEEIQKLYTENGVNPMGGCLWSLIPMFILFPLYAIIRRPMKYMMRLTETATTAVANALGWADFTVLGTNELTLASMLNPSNIGTVATSAGVTGLFVINFNFLGLDLAQVPSWKFWEGGLTWNSVGLFLLPVISAALSLLSSIVMNKTNAMNQQQAESMASQNRMMLIMMPIMSLWIGFTLPAGMCIYWIANSVLSMVQELVCGKILKKDYEEAQRKMAEQAAAAKAAEKERRRIAAEKKAAALAEKKSGKKKPAGQAKKADNGPSLDKEASRVGIRAYARGRAYDPNRYPVTEYRDPNVRQPPAPEEVTELTDEEKAILAESGSAAVEETAALDAPAPEETAVEEIAPIEELPTVEAPAAVPEEAAPEEGDYEAPYADEEGEDKPRFDTPEYTKPDYDGEHKE